jgi:hypothetical protein
MRMPKRIEALTDSRRLLHLAPALLLVAVAASSHAGSTAVRDADASRISVTAVGGEVAFTMAGNSANVAPNATVLLPARIVTGHDGNVSLTQAGTNVSVSSDTDVEIPAEAVDGNLIARLVQRRGNVFYDVAPRDLGKLRVETPLLVAVIKGTQFNVAVQPDSTTISLFEGRLEIRTPDNSEVVQIDAGEIAIRSSVDGIIRVVGMNDDRAAAPLPARPAAAAAARTAPAELNVANRAALSSDAAVARVDARETSAITKPLVAVGVDAVRAPAALDARVALGSADVGLSVGVGTAAVDFGSDASVGVGTAAVDVGLNAGLDLAGGSIDMGVDTRVDLAGAALDAGLGTGVDLGTGTVDLSLDTGVDLGGVLDTSVDAGVTLAPGTLDVDLGLDLGGTLDLGLDVDLGGGTLDLGLGTDTSTAPAPALAPPPPPPSPGNLLRGLLGLP